MIRSFLHGTAIGRTITNAFWKILGSDVHDLCGFDKHAETSKLKPWTTAMFTGCTFSILNYDTDFFELVRSGIVKVHIADLDYLSEGKVHLANATRDVLDSDGMLCATGWKHAPALKMFPEGIEREIGLPHLIQNGDDEHDLASQAGLFERADREILQRFPSLRNPPEFNKRYKPLIQQGAFSTDEPGAPESPLSPPLLYHFIAPVSPKFLRTKDFAVAGGVMNFSNALCTHIQGLWIAAYFGGKLARDPSSVLAVNTAEAVGEMGQVVRKDKLTLDDLQYETVLYNRFGKWRYPADHGWKYPDFVFDAVPYMDVLMADLGLQIHRKRGWLKEITDPYGPEDYIDINDEWKRKFA